MGDFMSSNRMRESIHRAACALAVATLVALGVGTGSAALAAPDPDPGQPVVTTVAAAPAETFSVAGSGLGSLFAIGFIASISGVLLSVLRRPEHEER
jgi:hypothetical protein